MTDMIFVVGIELKVYREGLIAIGIIGIRDVFLAFFAQEDAGAHARGVVLGDLSGDESQRVSRVEDVVDDEDVRVGEVVFETIRLSAQDHALACGRGPRIGTRNRHASLQGAIGATTRATKGRGRRG